MGMNGRADRRVLWEPFGTWERRYKASSRRRMEEIMKSNPLDNKIFNKTEFGVGGGGRRRGERLAGAVIAM